MCFDPASMAMMIAGTTAAAGGSMMAQKDAQKNAQRQTDARNAVVAQGVQKQGEYADANRGDFNTGVDAFAPATQAASLGAAQGARSADNVAAMTPGSAGDIPTTGSASPAVKGEIAKRLLATFQQSTDRAKAAGNLGGYSDAWTGNNLGVAQTGRDINTRNTQAGLDASTIGAKADLAQTGAYRPPSPWGPILQTAGTMLGSAAGRGFGGTSPGGSGLTLGPNPNGGGFAPMYR